LPSVPPHASPRSARAQATKKRPNQSPLGHLQTGASKAHAFHIIPSSTSQLLRQRLLCVSCDALVITLFYSQLDWTFSAVNKPACCRPSRHGSVNNSHLQGASCSSSPLSQSCAPHATSFVSNNCSSWRGSVVYLMRLTEPFCQELSDIQRGPDLGVCS
jgi:hypothetical protein